MRPSIRPAIFLVAMLAGCSSSNAPPPVTAPPPQIANMVSGTVLLRDPRELGSQSRVDVRVLDVAQPSIVLAQTTINNASRPPVMFSLPIDISKVDPKRTYAVEAVLTDGDRRYLPVLQYPVLTNRAPAKVEVVVAPEPTPGEKMYDEYKKVFGKIGGMKAINGTALNDTVSIGWDAFVSNGKVIVVREISDMDEKGRITMKMAFQNDKPWVVVKEESAAGVTKPYSTIKVGWDESGQLVLKDKLANGQTSEASAEEAKSIHDHAVQAFNTAAARVPKK